MPPWNVAVEKLWMNRAFPVDPSTPEQYFDEGRA
jgi:hypothetical protein